MNYKENSFDLIRLGAALLIMISHYLVNLFGIENITFSKWLFAGSSLVAFFVLCGFFLIPSLRQVNGKTYMAKRIMRIYPLYFISIVTTVISAYLLPIIRGGYTYPELKESLSYVFKMVLKPNTYVINGISNGAIWAVFIELQVYLLAAVFRRLLIENRSIIFWLSLFSLFIAVNIFSDTIVDCFNKHGMGILAQCYLSSALPYMYFFLIGVIAFKALPHNSSAALAMPFLPSASCRNLDLPPVNLRFLQSHLTKNAFAIAPTHSCGIALNSLTTLFRY